MSAPTQPTQPSRPRHYPGHRWINGEPLPAPLDRASKAVCVGRNYAEHARELNNPVPERPLLFLKPDTCFAPLSPSIVIPEDRGACHHELEIVLLIGRELRAASPEEALDAVAGVGIAIDLTLRELQSQLKEKGHPWERAKAFDGACPIGPFLPIEEVLNGGGVEALGLRLVVNGEERQRGSVSGMLMPPGPLLAEASCSFTFRPGDLLLTGTPAGVAALRPGDSLIAELLLGDQAPISIESEIII